MKKFTYASLILFLSALGAGSYFILTDDISQAKFRTMQDKIDSSEKVDLTGLADLQISGGPAIYFKHLKAQLSHVTKPIIIVDAQREAHGYIGNLPTSFFGCVRKSDLRHNIRRLIFRGTLDVCNKNIRPEKELAEAHGFQYQNINIDSKIKTPDEAVDKFVRFVDSLPEDTWVHFHCRLGKGRTSMMLIMFDTMKNAPHVSLKDIIKRQHLLGSEDLFNTVARRRGTYVSETLERRKKFVEYFYRFICDRKTGGPTLWSEWRAKHAD